MTDDGGQMTDSLKMNVEHRTSNVELRIENAWAQGAREKNRCQEIGSQMSVFEGEIS